MSWMAISSTIASRTSKGRLRKDLRLDSCLLVCTAEARMVSITGFSRRLVRVLVGIFRLGSSIIHADGLKRDTIR